MIAGVNTGSPTSGAYLPPAPRTASHRAHLTRPNAYPFEIGATQHEAIAGQDNEAAAVAVTGQRKGGGKSRGGKFRHEPKGQLQASPDKPAPVRNAGAVQFDADNPLRSRTGTSSSAGRGNANTGTTQISARTQGTQHLTLR